MPSAKNHLPPSSSDHADEPEESSDESSVKSHLSTTNSTTLRRSTRPRAPSRATSSVDSNSSQTLNHSQRKRQKVASSSNPSKISRGKAPQKVKKKRKTKKELLAEAATSTSVTTSSNILQNHQFDLEQGSNKENEKVKPQKARSIFAKVRDYFGTPKQGDKDPDEGPYRSYPCLWCKSLVRGDTDTAKNLEVHRDGSMQESKSGHPGCKARLEAIESGIHLPETAYKRRLKLKENGQDVVQSTWKFDNKLLNQILMFWILRQVLPWSRMQDPILRAAFRYSNPKAHLYGRSWTAHEAHRAYLSLSHCVMKTLKELDMTICLSQDVWTTPGNRYAFLGVTVTYIDHNWVYQTRHLALKLVAWYHKGEWLAEPLVGILKKNDLYQKLLAQTTNSGSNNYTMATAMHNRLSKIAQEAGEEYSWNPVDMVVKCFCHKMSLVVNAGLEALGVTPAPAQVVRKSVLGSFPVNDLLSAVEESLEEQEEGPSTVHQSAQIPISDDLINLEDPLDCDEQNDPLNEPAHTVGDDWYNDNNFSQSAPFVTPYAPTHEPVFIVPPATEDQQAASHLDGLLKRLDYVIRKLTSSSSMRALLAATAAAMGLSFDALIAGYGIRWNIKWDSRYRAWKARDIIDKILKNNQRDNEDCPASSNTGTHNPATNYGKGCFLKISFTPDDWKLIKVVNLELEHFALLTKRMEGDGPTGSMVIQEYLKLKKRLESRLLNASTTSPLYPMHYAMLTRVKKYLTEATSSHALLMATMLHPSWRGSFFTTGFGPRSPVTQKANRLLEDAYHIRKNQLEMSRSSPAPASGPEANVSSTECNDDSYDPMLHLHDAQKGTSTIDELAEYQLGRDAPSNDVAMDPKLALKWWQSHENKYPVLSTLARQYLAVSGSSAAVERTFSSAADVCTTDRGKLAPRTIERCVSSRLWIANGVQLDSEFEEAYQVMQKCIEFDEAARSQCANQAHFPGD